MSLRSGVISAGLSRSMSRDEVGPGQSSREELVDLQLRMASRSRTRESIGAVGKVLEIRLAVLEGPGRVVGREAGAAHGLQEAGAERRALGQVARLVEQLIGGVGVGRDDGVAGLEQSDREGMIDLGQPILAVGASRRVASARASSSAAARLPGRQLDAGQLVADLGGPPGRRVRPSGRSARPSARGIPIARQPFGDGAGDRRSSARSSASADFSPSADQGASGLVETSFLHGRDDLGGQHRRGRFDRAAGCRERRRPRR